MIQVLFAVLSTEVALILLLLIRCPLRKLVILGLDRFKRGRGPVMVKTVVATVFVVLASSLYSIRKIQERSTGVLSPTDQVLLSRNLLEASLMGYSLFLSLIIDRLHHYIREVRGMKKSVESVTKQNRLLEEGTCSSEEIKAKDREIISLNSQVTLLESDLEAKMAEVKTTEASAVALRKQSEGFHLEFDRMLENNRNLRSRLKLIDRKLSYSDIADVQELQISIGIINNRKGHQSIVSSKKGIRPTYKSFKTSSNEIQKSLFIYIEKIKDDHGPLLNDQHDHLILKLYVLLIQYA